MKVKTDTKEKFHAISVETPQLSANMAAELSNNLLKHLQTSNRNIVLNLQDVGSIDKEAAERLVNVQQKFYEGNASFVVCGLQPGVENFLDKEELLELMNITPTESEAWDILQMEEIERELLDGEEESF
jgi:anti-anti-sigma factor